MKKGRFRISWTLALLLIIMTDLNPSTELVSASKIAQPDPPADHRSLLSSLPVSGVPVPELMVFDQAMLDFMAARNIQAGTLTVMRSGTVLLEHGYGWQDRGEWKAYLPLVMKSSSLLRAVSLSDSTVSNHAVAISPSALMRVASIDKPITAAAIKRLISQGRLSPDAKVFPLLGVTAPAGQSPAPRLNDITIQHLLDHQGGWDSSQTGYDPMFRVVDIAAALGIPSPAGTPDIARYMAGQPLQFTPGTRSAYSNFGYALLRWIVERVSGRTFVSYLQQELGIDVDRSHAFSQDRNPREIWYSDPGRCTNVFQPSSIVPCADGGYNVESRSIAASSATLAHFLDHYWISGEPRSPGQLGYIYWFYGSLPGTFSFAYQRLDGVNIVALFNQRTDSSGLPYDNIKDVMDEAVASVVQWPTSGTRIAFYSSRDGNDEIYMMNANGSAQINMTNDSASDKFPSWSPDGTHVAFHSNRNGNWEIYLMGADGSGLTNLTNSPADEAFPSWSPDGARIAFSSNRTGNDDIFVMHADGSGQVRLTDSPANDLHPAWSPNGARIAFYSDRDGSTEIYLMDSNGNGQTRLTYNSAGDFDPAWSPDGAWIAFHSNRDGNNEIYVMKSDGSEQSRLTNNAFDDASPSWSPDGRRVAFHSNRDGNYEIYVMNSDGSGQARITDNSAWDGVPDWSPR
jgi:Tol biopolymer transport system component